MWRGIWDKSTKTLLEPHKLAKQATNLSSWACRDQIITPTEAVKPLLQIAGSFSCPYQCISVKNTKTNKKNLLCYFYENLLVITVGPVAQHVPLWRSFFTHIIISPNETSKANNLDGHSQHPFRAPVLFIGWGLCSSQVAHRVPHAVFKCVVFN